MENIRYPPHQPPPPPPQPQQYVGGGYGWGQLQADMANLRTTQTKFYESILAQNASYGLHLREIEVKQNDMWAKQSQYKDVRAYQEQQKKYQKLQQEQFQQIQAEQAQIHKEFTDYKKNFSTRGSANRDGKHKPQPVIPYSEFGSKELLYLLGTPTDEPKPCSRTTH
ncbi:hypothetical protein PIB30_102834 [Stylosanthes scabra]|uniref:Uncharacterized protein n=1 Tax=Stylosanthes scabra TaxID=79078 RepID=A0ABU6ZWI5_9FABA|nr:hypothetical protein [Stylosanthes scabra]